MGDFNLHLENSTGNTTKIDEILPCFDLKQHGNFPTHVHGHWLHFLITNFNYQLISISNAIKSVFQTAGISDHLAVISIYGCKGQIEKGKPTVPQNKQNDYNSLQSEKDLSERRQQNDSVLLALS